VIYTAWHTAAVRAVTAQAAANGIQVSMAGELSALHMFDGGAADGAVPLVDWCYRTMATSMGKPRSAALHLTAI